MKFKHKIMHEVEAKKYINLYFLYFFPVIPVSNKKTFKMDFSFAFNKNHQLIDILMLL